METYGCEGCKKLFLDQGNPGRCPYCSSIYYTWITYAERTMSEVKNLLKKFSK